MVDFPMTSSSMCSFPCCWDNGPQIITFWLVLSRFFCFRFIHLYRTQWQETSNLGNTNQRLFENIYKISRLRQLKIITNNNISPKYFSTQFVCDDYIFKHTSRKPSVTNIDVREMRSWPEHLVFCLVVLNFILDQKFANTSKVQCIYA